jgi:hypoxanthine phosphoribosyltransferase
MAQRTKQNGSTTMLDEIKKVQNNAQLIYTEEQVEKAITHMAQKISYLLKDRNPVVLSVLTGGIVVTGKLLTQLDFPLTLDVITATRYNNKTTGGHIEWLQKPATPLKDRTVLIVDDILDEGLTLKAIVEYCLNQGASSVYTAVLIHKKITQAKPILADFIGLETEDFYLYGYGMDYKGYLRNAAGIFACHQEE